MPFWIFKREVKRQETEQAVNEIGRKLREEGRVVLTQKNIVSDSPCNKPQLILITLLLPPCSCYQERHGHGGFKKVEEGKTSLSFGFVLIQSLCNGIPSFLDAKHINKVKERWGTGNWERVK